MNDLKEIMLKENSIYPDATLPNIIDVVRTIYTYVVLMKSLLLMIQLKTKYQIKRISF